MPHPELDPWDKAELTAVRHAGTLYAGAVALIAALRSDHGFASSSLLLRGAVCLLLIGAAGSTAYQLTTIYHRAARQVVIRQISAWLVCAGIGGFILLAIYIF